MTTSSRNLNFKHIVPDGAILKIVGNCTQHNFELGTSVINCAQLERGNPTDRCIYAVCAPTGSQLTPHPQYLSSGCAQVIGQAIVHESMDYAAYQAALAKTLVDKATNMPQYLTGLYVQTQKARGLQVLTKFGLLNTPIYLLADAITRLPVSCTFPLMARPCPVKPRHGFVESRMVNSIEEINNILTETKAHDPHGEVILMSRFESAYSAVVTDSAVTIGPGTDGATAGKQSVTIPCQSRIYATLQSKGSHIPCTHKKHGALNLRILPYARIKPQDQIFVETVGRHVVQLRTGPQADYSQTRFSPWPSISVRHVITGAYNMDFLQFEQVLDKYEALSVVSSTVLHLPNGSLSSHYAVQAIARGFSVVAEPTSIKPYSTLTFSRAASRLPITAPLRLAIVRGCTLGMHIEPTSQHLEWAVAIIQGLAATAHNTHSIALLSAASVLLARIGAGLCFGEHRHFHRRGPGRVGLLPSGPVRLKLTRKRFTKTLPCPERDTIYTQAFTLRWDNPSTWYKYSSYLQGVKHDFHTAPWAGGYGGSKWADCTQASLDLMYAVMPLTLVTRTVPHVEHPSHTTLHDQVFNCILAANKLIAMSHNTAKCLTKLISLEKLTAISRGNTGLPIATSPLTWELVKPDEPRTT